MVKEKSKNKQIYSILLNLTNIYALSQGLSQLPLPLYSISFANFFP